MRDGDGGAQVEDVTPLAQYLPADALLRIFGFLGARDLAAAGEACSSWQRFAKCGTLWRERYKQRWHSEVVDGEWEALKQAGQWRSLYLQRCQVDQQASRAVQRLQWPQRSHAAMEELRRLRFLNIKDALARLASQSNSCGTVYWARYAYLELNGQYCAEQMRTLVGAADAAAAGVSGSGQHQQAQHQQAQQQQAQQQQPEQQTDPHVLLLDNGARLLAAAHQPFVESGWVGGALDALGKELGRRLTAAGAAPDSLDALRLLNQLLFGESPGPRSSHFASIPPPAGHGLELQGNRDTYYDPANSYLNVVLAQREGIPISLAVLHSAVAARAGMHVLPVNLPMHVVTHFGRADAPDERFIDVFDHGRILTRVEMGDFMRNLGLPGFDRELLTPMTPRQCWARMCRNLLHIHREQVDFPLQKVAAQLLAALAEPGTVEGLRAARDACNACLHLHQFEEAIGLLQGMLDMAESGHLLGDPQIIGIDENATRELMAHIQENAQRYIQEQMAVHPRTGAAAPLRFKVGQVIRHRAYQYRGVIIGWDPSCAASDAWCQQMGVDRLPGGRGQPFYHVLVHPEDRGAAQQTYVAEENVLLEPLPRIHRRPGYELHPEVGRYFECLEPDGSRYQLNDWMRHRFPEG